MSTATETGLDDLTEEQVWEETTVLPPVPCEMLGHEEYGDGPAGFRAVLRHEDCGRADLTLLCEACLLVTANPNHGWRCQRCDGVVHGGKFVTNVARLLGRA